MIYFHFNIPLVVIVLMSCTGLFAVICAVFGLKPLCRVSRRGLQLIEEEEVLCAVPDEKLPSVSVVVYARNVEYRIEEFVRSVLNQDYPDFEVIVVNDASSDMTRERVENLMHDCPALKYTFVPESAKNISRKKMAYALGVKGAKGDVVVTTAATCKIESTRWLRLLCSPFADKKIEMALGYAEIPPELTRGRGSRIRSFDTTLSSAQWIAAAMADKAFRGVEYNMAFRRHLFFDMKGYVSSLSLQGGHDDMFVGDVAKRGRVAMVLHPEGRVKIDCEAEQFRRLWKNRKEHRVFMAKFLRTAAYRLQGFNSLCLWLSLACAVAAIAFSSPNLFPAAVVVALLLMLWGYQVCVYRRVAQVLGALPLRWSVPVFFLLRPFVSARYRSRVRRERELHYAWADSVSRRGTSGNY